MSYDNYTIDKKEYNLKIEKDFNIICLIYNKYFATNFNDITDIFYDFFTKYTIDKYCENINKNLENDNKSISSISFYLLKHFEKINNITVYRSFNLENDEIYNKMCCVKGYIFNKKFTSTTTSKEIALKWSGKYLLIILINNSYILRLSTISNFKNEDEILLPCYSYIKIIEIYDHVIKGELEYNLLFEDIENNKIIKNNEQKIKDNNNNKITKKTGDVIGINFVPDNINAPVSIAYNTDRRTIDRKERNDILNRPIVKIYKESPNVKEPCIII